MPDVVGVESERAGATVVRVPGDKSISHRALILAALARGTSRLRGVLDAADTRSTADALRTLGVAIPALSPPDGEVLVDGVGVKGFRCAPGAVLDCGNSGTTARLLTGLLAGSGVDAVLDGDTSLRRRPMDRVILPLRAMGADLEGEGLRLPVRVRPAALRAHSCASPVASAQVKSALLLAGLTAGVRVEVSEPTLSRDHTERMLAWMGVAIDSAPRTGGRADAGDAADGPAVRLEPLAGELRPLDLDVPGDPSSAAYFAAFAALVPGARVRTPGISLNPTRIGFFHALRRMGADVRGLPVSPPPRAQTDAGSVERAPGEWRPAPAGEPRGAIEVVTSPLRGITVAAAEVPWMIDELPLLAVLGAVAGGETVIRGAAELRVKESDRIEATVAGLRAVGVEAVAEPDGLRVKGSEGPLRGSVETHGDHRLAMAFGVLAARPGNHVEVDDPNAVDVSFPAFWEELARVRAEVGSR